MRGDKARAAVARFQASCGPASNPRRGGFYGHHKHGAAAKAYRVRLGRRVNVHGGEYKVPEEQR